MFLGIFLLIKSEEKKKSIFKTQEDRYALNGMGCLREFSLSHCFCGTCAILPKKKRRKFSLNEADLCGVRNVFFFPFLSFLSFLVIRSFFLLLLHSIDAIFFPFLFFVKRNHRRRE